MADGTSISLPLMSPSKRAEGAKREIMLVQFTQDNNVLLVKQAEMLQQIGNTMKSIEMAMLGSLKLDQREATLNARADAEARLGQVESAREAQNDKRSRMSSVVSSAAGMAARLGLKAILAAATVGFVGELLGWGKKLEGMRERWFGEQGIITGIQNKLVAWGNKVEELTGSKALGGVVKSLLLLSPAIAVALWMMKGMLAKLAIGATKMAWTAGAKAVAAVRAGKVAGAAAGVKSAGGMAVFGAGAGGAGALSQATGTLAKIGQFAKVFLSQVTGTLAKIGQFAKVFAKALPVIGWVIVAIEGLVGAIPAAIEGWKQDGLKGALIGGIRGAVHGIVDGILELLQGISVWILEALGFDKMAASLDSMDVSKLTSWVMDGIGALFTQITGMWGALIKAIMNFDYLKLMNTAIDALPVPDVVKAGIKQSIRAQVATATAVASAAGKAWDGMSNVASSARGAVDDFYGDSMDATIAATGTAKDGQKRGSRGRGTTRVGGNKAETGTAKDGQKRGSRGRGTTRVAGNKADFSGVTSTSSNATGNMVAGMGNSAQRATMAAMGGGGKSSAGGDAGALLDLIAKGESGSAGYDAYWLGTRIKPKKPMSQMTFGEVRAWQTETLNEQISRGIPFGRRSSAAGRYQFISDTLRDTMELAGITDSQPFNAANQDKLVMALLNSSPHGWNAYKSGKASSDQFVDFVASQFASVKNSAGAGVYNDAGFNHASIGGNSVIAAANGMSAPSMPSMSPRSAPSSGSSVSSATTAVASVSSGSSGGATNVNAPTTNVSNQTTNQAPTMSASTPVEFAPHVMA